MLVPDRVDHAAARVEVGELLVVVADRDVVAGRHRASDRRETAGESLQERGLPAPVFAQESQSLAAKQLEADPAHDRSPGGVARVEVLRAEERPAPDPGGVEAK